MKLVRHCDVPLKKTCCYILAKSQHDAYQWFSVPQVQGASACRSFYQFIYGSPRGYRRAKAQVNTPTALHETGKLTVLEDGKMHYIILTDPLYDNAAVLKTGTPTSLSPKITKLIAPQRLSTQRKKTLTDAVASSAILADYKHFKHIASGSVGEVFSMTLGDRRSSEQSGRQSGQRSGLRSGLRSGRRSEPRGDQLYVAKLQHLSTAAERRGFEQEVSVQRVFADQKIGLPLVDVQVFKTGKLTVGVTVMPMVQTLHEYLHAKRTRVELDAVVAALVKLLESMQAAQLTHGDLALFNMYVEAKPFKLKVLDFDRASVDIFAPDVDVLRVATELSASTRSEAPDGKPIHPFNDQFLGTTGLAKFQTAFGGEFELDGRPVDIDDEWRAAYGQYCTHAHVKCL